MFLLKEIMHFQKRIKEAFGGEDGEEEFLA
jgi:hypothetical protein